MANHHPHSHALPQGGGGGTKEMMRPCLHLHDTLISLGRKVVGFVVAVPAHQLPPVNFVRRNGLVRPPLPPPSTPSCLTYFDAVSLAAGPQEVPGTKEMINPV